MFFPVPLVEAVVTVRPFWGQFPVTMEDHLNDGAGIV